MSLGSPSRFQVPVNFLGDFKAGKSSVAASLEGNRPIRVAEEDRTVGADVKQVLFDEMDFHIVDAGGHESYTFLHHLYLTAFAIHAIFIKVGHRFDAADCSRQLNRWMYMVTAKFPASKFVVVLSKCDELSPDILEMAVDGLESELESIKRDEAIAVDKWSDNLKSSLSAVHIDGEKLPGYETIMNNMKDAEAMKTQQPTFIGGVICMSCEKGKERGFKEFLERCTSAVKEAGGSGHFFRLSEFPKKWKVFLDSILQCRSKDCLALTMSEVRQKAAEVGIPEEDVDLCLFLFKVMGHILHYEFSENDLNQYVFHDPKRIAGVFGHLVHHDLSQQLEVYIRSHVSNMKEGEHVRRCLKNGVVPRCFIKSQLLKKYRSESASFGDAILQLALYINLCIVVSDREGKGEPMVFIPCLVSRSRHDVEHELCKKWGSDNEEGWEDFVVHLQLHKALPIGFVERVVVEVAPFTSGNVNYKNGFFCNGWKCRILLEEVAEPSNEFSRLVFNIRVASSNRDEATQDLTWLYFIFQNTLSFYPGVLARAVAPCKGCGEHSYDVKECLNQPYDVLKRMKCPQCGLTNPQYSAADVFPVKKPGMYASW